MTVCFSLMKTWAARTSWSTGSSWTTSTPMATSGTMPTVSKWSTSNCGSVRSTTCRPRTTLPAISTRFKAQSLSATRTQTNRWRSWRIALWQAQLASETAETLSWCRTDELLDSTQMVSPNPLMTGIASIMASKSRPHTSCRFSTEWRQMLIAPPSQSSESSNFSLNSRCCSCIRRISLLIRSSLLRMHQKWTWANRVS